jgi:bifunctional NMN adenylyltransferase/nudix hydrolase
MATKKAPSVGVIVGRFQVDDLHEGHIDLIKYVVDRHERVIILLGMTPLKVTRNNPLDFSAREQMIKSTFPDITILSIKDINNDEVWSKVLDETIHDHVGPTTPVVLYGSRESFISHYTGKYKTFEYEQEVYVSGTDVRDTISAACKASPDFRKGVIWAAHNQFPKVYTTVDIAVWNEDRTKLLLARKPNRSVYCFIGGFADPSENFETAARREVGEESQIEITDPEYVGSFPIDDWRYRRELDSITTVFFEAKHMFGKPTPTDDIVELRWFEFDKIDPKRDLSETHHVLFDALKKRESSIKETKEEDDEN